MPDGGQQLSFRLFGRGSSQTSQQSVQFVTGWLEDIGIEVKPKIVSEDALTEIIGEGNFDLFEWGWVVEPDPNYQLSTFTCANRSYKDGGSVYANLSDSFYCDKEYDRCTPSRPSRSTRPSAPRPSRRCRRCSTIGAPYIVTFYYDNLEAYRSDRFTGFQPQPAPDGSLLFQYGTCSYQSIRPVTEEDTKGGGGGRRGRRASTTAATRWPSAVSWRRWSALGIGGFLLARNRRRPDADVE